MATTTEKNKTTAAAAPLAIPTLDRDAWKKDLPEGFSDADFKKVGALTPIYSSEYAFANKLPPAVGWIVRLEMVQIDKTKEEEPRPFLRVELLSDNIGILGAKRDQKAVHIKKGEDILVPVSGAIKNIEQIKIACVDPMNIYLAKFEVVGQEQVNDKPSAMWVIDTQLNKNTRPRDGRFLLNTSQVNPNPIKEYVTTDGEVVAVPQN